MSGGFVGIVGKVGFSGVFVGMELSKKVELVIVDLGDRDVELADVRSIGVGGVVWVDNSGDGIGGGHSVIL